jgi:hypothetical protein
MCPTFTLLVFLATVLLCVPAYAEPLTRAEAIRIAEAYCNYQWNATDKNVLQGKDGDGVEVHTPNVAPGAAPDPKLWVSGTTNTGMPYKWGGFDTIDSFAAGIKAGKAGGDMYTQEKRRLGGAAVSSHAVGIDCSGFISRCWKLPSKQSTETLPDLCKTLTSPDDLKPGDIMDAAGGHVILFAKWLDDQKSNALFYEASPFCKVIANPRSIDELVAEGYQPLRYKKIVD